MAESCPNACEYCENGGLMPTPSPFQLDLVCKDQLAINSGAYKGGAADDLPSNCEFRCRDNMTESICAKAAAEGKCQDKAVAKAVRKQCPASCGVCKALGMATATPYPKGACREAEGNSAEHEASCAAWAEAGECFNNFGFMSISCEAGARTPSRRPQPHARLVRSRAHRVPPACPPEARCACAAAWVDVDGPRLRRARLCIHRASPRRYVPRVGHAQRIRHVRMVGS
jgi:hypothetical protein